MKEYFSNKARATTYKQYGGTFDVVSSALFSYLQSVLTQSLVTNPMTIDETENESVARLKTLVNSAQAQILDGNPTDRLAKIFVIW